MSLTLKRVWLEIDKKIAAYAAQHQPPAPSVVSMGYESIENIGCVPDDPNIDNGAIINAYTADKTMANLFIPNGLWYCDTTINIINRTISMRGQNMNGSVFTFPMGRTGIRVDRNKQATSQMLEGCLENFMIQARGKDTTADISSDEAAQGIKLWQRYQLRDISIYGFAFRGLEIFGALQSLGHDANLIKATNVRIASCGSDGVFIVGPDSNAGTFTSIDVVDCRGWGINDHSFLGNTWIGCHTNNNKGGSYNVQNSTAASLFMGCYSEVGQPPARFHKAVVAMGGLHGAGINWV